MQHINCYSERLKELLEINGVEVKDVSEATDIDKSNFYNFLNGKHIPSLENVIKIANFFKCPLDYFFGFCDCFDKADYTYTASVTERYRQAIDNCKISRYILSKQSKICQQTLSRWYHGKQIPSLSNLVILAEYLDCSLDFLAGRDY